MHVMREVVASFERPVLLFSGGKDSIVLLRLGGEGVSSGWVSVSVVAYRYRRELSRGNRFS
jgi:sulfate adenylyltransferase subunit 2